MREQAIAVEISERGPSNLVLLTLELTQEEDVWVGTCIELGTSAYADTIEELRGEIADAIGLQLNEAMRLGFIDEYIQERNVRTLPLIQLENWERCRRGSVLAWLPWGSDTCLRA